MGRFIKPQIVRLPLSQGDFIDVKRRLNAGEMQDMMARMTPLMTPNEVIRLNSREVFTAKVLAYLLGWSLTDDGVPVPMTPEMSDEARLATIRNLDPETFAEIRMAIETHEELVDREVEAAKNGQAGASPSSPTAPSPNTTGGDSETSVN